MRPKKWDCPKKLERAINKYFKDIEKKNSENPFKEHPTVSGLSYALGITRETLNQYQKQDEFSDTIKLAKTRIEAYLEQRLFLTSPTGVIFNLKNNFGWKDKTEVEHEGDIFKGVEVVFTK